MLLLISHRTLNQIYSYHKIGQLAINYDNNRLTEEKTYMQSFLSLRLIRLIDWLN
jgi:hypothetical protein